MVKNRIKKAVSFLGLTLLVASSMTPVQSGPREDNVKHLFAKLRPVQNAQKPMDDAEAACAVGEFYGKGRKNDQKVWDECIANRAAAAAPAPVAAAPAPAPQRYVPTPEELAKGRAALQPVPGPRLGPKEMTDTQRFQRELIEGKKALQPVPGPRLGPKEMTDTQRFEKSLRDTKAKLRSGNEAEFDDMMRNIEGFLPETDKEAFERELVEAKGNLRSGNEAPFDDFMRNAKQVPVDALIVELKDEIKSGNEAEFDAFMRNIEGDLPANQKAVVDNQAIQAKENLLAGNDAAFDDFMRNVEAVQGDDDRPGMVCRIKDAVTGPVKACYKWFFG